MKYDDLGSLSISTKDKKMKNTISTHNKLTSLLTLIFLVCLIGASYSQSQYDSGMQKGFGLWKENKAMEASALFERIAQAEKDNWIPYYYAANTLITASFESKDATKTNEILKKAATFIEKANKLSPDNSELRTLEGLLYTGYVAMDPATYGMQYSGKIMNLHAEAIELDPANPRAQLNKIEYEIGSARFFGTALSTFCDAIVGTKPLFDNQKKPSAYYPNYGVDRIELLQKQCDCK